MDKATNDDVMPLSIAAELGHCEVVEELLKCWLDTSSVRSISGDQGRGLFLEHEEQLRNMLAMACRLHSRLVAWSRVFTFDNTCNLLKMIWEQVERWCSVPAAEEEEDREAS